MTGIALLGECMLELSPAEPAGHYRLGVAGDTYNTAATLAQLGGATEYLSALGTDRHSAQIIEQMGALGIGHHWLERCEDLAPGLYLIDNDSEGERFFSYWRSGSAAHRILSDPGALVTLLERARDCPRLMLSGITLALCGAQGRPALLDWLDAYRGRGGEVIYDGNFRPALWPDLETATQSHRDMLQRVDVFLAGAEDELQLRPGCDRDQLRSLLDHTSAREIVLKDGSATVLAWDDHGKYRVEPEPAEVIADATGAGDSFNGAYLAARFSGCAVDVSLGFACRVAALTVAHRGAILPREQWPGLLADLGGLAR